MKPIRLSILYVLSLLAFAFYSCNTSDNEPVVVPKEKSVYLEQLRSFVNSELAKVNSCVVGYDKGNFRQNSASSFPAQQKAYLDALNAAATALSTPDNLTIPGIVAIDKTLGAPGKTFNAQILISDHRALNDAIVDATALNNSTPAGSASGQAPQAAKTAFAAAITAATNIRNSVTAIDRNVTDGIAALSAAKAVFTAAIIK